MSAALLVRAVLPPPRPATPAWLTRFEAVSLFLCRRTDDGEGGNGSHHRKVVAAVASPTGKGTDEMKSVAAASSGRRAASEPPNVGRSQRAGQPDGDMSGRWC